MSNVKCLLLMDKNKAECFLPFYLLVNELAPLLRPHEIHPRTDGIPSDKQVEVRAALRQPTVSILRIQQP